MLVKSVLILFIFLVLSNAVFYDSYNGTRVSETMLAYYNSTGRLATCTIDVKPCNLMEHRRIDGSCNNLDNPSEGTFNVVRPRLLPACYFNDTYPRKAVSGKELPLPRRVRVKLLPEGTSLNTVLTQAVPGFAIFSFADIGSVHDTSFFLVNKTDCCSSGKNDYMCTPNIVPKDDPVHRFSGIRCLNMTRPLDFQYLGCTNDSVLSPIQQATAVYDLSQIYNSDNKGDTAVRSFEGGLLLTEVEDGIIWPPNGGFCPANWPGAKCFKNYPNSLLTTQLFSTWFMRLHNYFAEQLAKINPCWDDNQLFYSARELNIAFSQQIYIYEWLTLLVGKKNLIQCGIASDSYGCRDFYDETTYPLTTLEFLLVNRWFHIIQHGSTKMFDTDGTFLKEFPIVNCTFRTGYLAEGKNIFQFTQGNFRTPARKANDGVDPDIAQMGLPYVQRSVDVPTSDLHKNRLVGVRPYIDYVHHCFGYKINSWNDLRQIMDEDRINIMQDVYDDVKDIDLMAGIWSERLLKGGNIPQTMACLFKDSILKTITGDRHWFERCNRPHAFTHAQLQEIRKASLALLICTVGDGVTEIQRQAFMNISPKNPLVSCYDIPKIDFRHWANCTTTSN